MNPRTLLILGGAGIAGWGLYQITRPKPAVTPTPPEVLERERRGRYALYGGGGLALATLIW